MMDSTSVNMDTHGHLRIDIEDDTLTVVISIIEFQHGGAETHSIEIDYQTARTFAHYILEYCTNE